MYTAQLERYNLFLTYTLALPVENKLLCVLPCPSSGVLSTAEGADEQALRKLFMRMDANCDAVIDWEEFSSYLLLQKASSSTLQNVVDGSTLHFETLDYVPLPLGQVHRELMTCAVYVNTGQGIDKWFTMGRDGAVHVWNAKVSAMRYMS